jgi:hypothetical protein
MVRAPMLGKTAGGGGARAVALVGIGEQQPTILADPWWRALQIHRVRYVAAAHAAGADVLLGFGHSRVPSRVRRLPTPRQFQREFLRVRARYPWVHEFVTWNEANHCSQPTCRRPDVAEGLPPPRARPQAHLGAAQLHRRQPLPHSRDAQPPPDGAGSGVVHRDRRPGRAKQRVAGGVP